MNISRIFILSFFLCGLFSQAGFPESSACPNQICFQSVQQAGGTDLQLRGRALFEFMGFNLYSGALYLPQAVRPEDALGEVPKILMLHYQRKIKVSWMTRAAERILKRNPGNQYEALQERLKKINQAYRPVAKDDRYSLVYVPGEGTSLYLNEELLIQIPGEDFQRAYFGIWLSDYPIKEKARDQLLGKRGPEQ